MIIKYKFTHKGTRLIRGLKNISNIIARLYRLKPQKNIKRIIIKKERHAMSIPPFSTFLLP